MTGGWGLEAALAAWPAAGLVAIACHRRLDEAREAAIAGLVLALSSHDLYTAEHTERVARYAVLIGQELGWSSRRLARLRRAALLHDIGKLAVPVELLNKPGPLTEDEYSQVQRHESAGADMLARIGVLRRFASVVEPAVAVADAYDAMTSTRAYRRALRQEVAFAELRARSGTQFDPTCVDALIRSIERRGERHGLGFERSHVVYAVEPPVAGVLCS